MRSLLLTSIFLLPLSTSAQEDLSTIAVPIRATLAPLLPLVEAQVPKTFRDRVVERAFTVTYEVTRDPIRLRMVGTGLHATMTAHYALQACPKRLPCVSCGMNERKRDAVVTLHAHFTWDQAWRLRSSTRPLPPHFPNRCRVSLFEIDITDRYIAPVIHEQLGEVSKTIDRHTPDLTNIQSVARDMWRSLQEPTEIAPRTFLLFDPLDAALGAVSGTELVVSSTLTMRARTRIVVGARPRIKPKPLPPLLYGETAGGFRVPLDLDVPYHEASNLGTKEFGHRTYKLKRGTLHIEDIRIGEGTAGRISVTAGIRYDGGRLKRYQGPVVLEGRPRFDPATRSIVVPDLEYSVETRRRSLFFKVGERLAHDSVRAQLRASARWPLKDDIATARAEINRAMNRPISRGVTLRGEVAAIEPQRVTPSRHGLVVRVAVTGTATVDVTQWK